MNTNLNTIAEENWCEQCAMAVEVDECNNCINCGQPTNQKLEKFECPDCGCYFMVADRNDFVCPNCESLKSEIDDTKKSLITAYVSNELSGEKETPYRVHIEQNNETKEYGHYETEVLAEERAEYINRLYTSDWNML